MDLQYSEADQDFRQKARSWLSTNVPQTRRPAMGHAAEQFDRDWQRKLYDHGWAGISWPKEFGGLGLSGLQQVIWYEELGRARAPHYINTTYVALMHAGPTVIARGTDAQRAFHLPKILSGEAVHAGTLNANPLCLAASKWCLDEVLAQGADFPAATRALGRRLMEGLTGLARAQGVPLRPQGPGLIFHAVMLKPGAAEGPIRDYRDYVRRHDAPRWAHLRRCLLEEGVRAIERGLWSISTTHTAADIDEALRRAAPAFARHAATWQAPA